MRASAESPVHFSRRLVAALALLALLLGLAPLPPAAAPAPPNEIGDSRSLGSFDELHPAKLERGARLTSVDAAVDRGDAPDGALSPARQVEPVPAVLHRWSDPGSNPDRPAGFGRPQPTGPPSFG